jgi:tRNA G18 (ribose-2'-O)-methylase SpoU
VGIVRIESDADARLADFRNIPDRDLLVRRGLFVAEGRLVVTRLLASGLDTRALLVTEPALASLGESVANGAFPVYVVPQSVLNNVAGFNFHRGCLALAPRPPDREWRALANGARRLVILERVGNVDNIGAIFRNAAAFGVDGVLLQADCADPLYRKAIRTSMAATLTVPYASVPWPDALRELSATGWATIAMTPARDAPLLESLAPTLSDRPIAIVLGHEGDGLTPEACEACAHRARIAMAEGVDSVNVATAAAIALYEVHRPPSTAHGR